MKRRVDERVQARGLEVVEVAGANQVARQVVPDRRNAGGRDGGNGREQARHERLIGGTGRAGDAAHGLHLVEVVSVPLTGERRRRLRVELARAADHERRDIGVVRELGRRHWQGARAASTRAGREASTRGGPIPAVAAAQIENARERRRRRRARRPVRPLRAAG